MRPELRRVVDALYGASLTIPEASAALGVSTATVQRRHAVALRQLAALLGAEKR